MATILLFRVIFLVLMCCGIIVFMFCSPFWILGGIAKAVKELLEKSR